MTSSWDVFHSVRLEVERGVAAARVRERLASGDLNDDDLIRPAGTVRWSRIAQVAFFNTPAEAPAAIEAPPAPAPVEMSDPPPPTPAEPAEPLRLRLRPESSLDLEPAPPPPTPAPVELGFPPEPDLEASIEAEPIRFVAPNPIEVAELDSIEAEPVPPPRPAADLDSIEAEPVDLAAPFAFDPDEDEDDEEPVELGGSSVVLTVAEPDPEPPTLPDDEAGGPRSPELGDPLAAELEAGDAVEDDPASDFTLTRNSTETVEELDLAAMVDVAFQLVLFFLVTASTIVFKTLEVPKPNEDKPPEAAVQSRAKSLDELEKDYILVEVDAEGAVKVDHNPVNADRAALVEKLRQAREMTGRKAMLLSTDFATRHKNAVLAFDVAGEIDLQIAIAQPTGKN